MKGLHKCETLFSLLILVGVLSELTNCFDIAKIRSDLARGGRYVCPYCSACAYSWNCDRPCRPNYRTLCPLCAYRFHCSSTCVTLCSIPETPEPTTPPPTTPEPTTPEPTTPEPTTPQPTTPAPTTPQPTTPEPTTPDPENDACSPNPCPFDGNCQRASAGYTCSCPADSPACTEESMDVFQKYDYSRQGPSEVTTSLANPFTALEFKSIYDETFQELKGLGIPGIHNGKQDALRHALVNYRWTQAENAGKAKQFGDAHERSNPNPFSEMAMDLHNNAMGRELAQDPANAGRDSLEVVMEAYDNGVLQRLPNPQHSQQTDVSDTY